MVEIILEDVPERQNLNYLLLLKKCLNSAYLRTEEVKARRDRELPPPHILFFIICLGV